MNYLHHIILLKTPQDLIKCLEDICPDLKGEYKVNEWDVESLYPYNHRFYYDRIHSVLEIRELSIGDKRDYIGRDLLIASNPEMFNDFPHDKAKEELNKYWKDRSEKLDKIEEILIGYEKLLKDAQR